MTGTKVVKGGALTFDLNGYTLNTGSYTLSISSGAEIIIKNGAITGSAAGPLSGIIKMTSSDASLTMVDVEVTNTTTSTSTSNVIYFDPKENITFTATNCSFSISSSNGRVIAGGSGTGESTVTFDGCTLSSAYRTVVLTGGGYTFNATNCNISTSSSDSTDAAIYLSTAKMTANISDTVITAENGANAINTNSSSSATATITLSGDMDVTGDISSKYETITITGGTYSSDVSEYQYVDLDTYMVVNNGDGTYTVTMIASTGILGISTDAAGTEPSISGEIVFGEGTDEIYVNVAAADISANYTATAYPTTNLTYTGTSGDDCDYVFAGWYYENAGDYVAYGSEEADDDHSTFDFTSEAYAKFVDADVLTMKYQITAGTTSETASTNMRFVTTVDSLKYNAVGFVITINGKQKTVSSKKVYEQIVAKIDGDAFSYTPSTFSSASNYFMTYSLLNIPDTSYDTEITVVPYWETMDGTKVYGVERVVKVSDSF